MFRFLKRFFIFLHKRYLQSLGSRSALELQAARVEPLPVLSEHSVESDRVEHEARLARGPEVETKRGILCPVALDDSRRTRRWPERLREQTMEYNLLDFSGWRDAENFCRMFTRLLDGPDLFCK